MRAEHQNAGACRAPLLALLLVLISFVPAGSADGLSRSGNADLPGTISRANLDGTGKELSFIESSKGACGVTLDASHIYWGTADGVGRANLDGSGVDESFITGVGDACAVAVDAAHVYWTDPFSGPIGRANLDGSGVNADFIPGAGACALAVESAHLYWVTPAESDPSGLGDPGSMGRANLDGTGVNPNFIAGKVPGGPAFSCAVAVDSAHLYWGGSGGYSVARADLDGTDIDPSFIDFPTGPPAWFGMAVDTGHVYWPDPYSTLARARLDGTDLNPSFITGGYDPRGVAVDAQHIYWANKTNPSEFSLFKVKRDRERGTATLLLEVPGPGVVRLRGHWVVKATRRATRFSVTTPYGFVELPVKAKRKKRRELNRRGRTKLKAKITYTPDGGEPNTQTKRVRLVKRR